MLNLIIFIVRSILSLFKADHRLLMENLILKKENEILKRKLKVNRIRISNPDKLFFVILNMIGNIKDQISLFSPQTLLHWQRLLIRSLWNFIKSDSHPGRKPVPVEIKNLILKMKNDNLNWGAKRIRDELLKITIHLHKKTIQNIIIDFRRKGKVRKTYTWKQFLKAHADYLFAMDYFTVDTIFNKRFCVLFLISHKTREIVQLAISQNPTAQFVKQQIIEFEQKINSTVYLIHDRDPSFMCIDYISYNIKNICTSIKAPNMNAIAERFIRSVRNKALDNFIIYGEKQISKIIKEYIQYYNLIRPHQGINKIPKGKPPNISFSDFSTEDINNPMGKKYR